MDEFSIFDEFLSRDHGVNEREIANFLNETQNDEAPEGGGSLIFWEQTNELQRDVLIKVGMFKSCYSFFISESVYLLFS